jgi:heterodisulfide reductase subunit A
VHIYFAQAIPLIAYIDESCLYLKEKKCRICEAVCKNDAIDLSQTPQKKEINVGAVILASGIEPFDPKVRAEYRYGEFRNVVTSMDFERLLCSPGPYGGEILRASDKSTPIRSPGSSASGRDRSLRGATATAPPSAAPTRRSRRF